MRLLALALLVCGCSGTFEESARPRFALGASAPARDELHCRAVDQRHGTMVTAAWLDGSIAGASGAVAGALPSDVPSGYRIGLGAAAAGFAAMAVYATTAASAAATEWARDCAVEVSK